MYLGLDLGTSSLKAVIVDADPIAHWVGEERYQLDVAANRAQIAPSVWWAACVRALAAAPRDLLSQVRGIGFSGQMHGMVPCDAGGGPLRDAILWPDRRAGDHLDLFGEIDRADPGVLGNPIVPGMPGPVLAWLAAHEPEVVQAAAAFVAPKDWLRSCITGETSIVTDASDASATLLYDVWRDDWSAAVIERLGIDRCQLPTIRDSSAVAGQLSAEAAAVLGLAPGITVSVGAGDAAAALLGTGIEQPGTVVVNVGTGAQVLTLVDEPALGRVELGLHQFRTASRPGRWYVMAPIINAGLALSWVRKTLGLSWDQIYDEAPRALACQASDPVFVPFLSGERDPEIGLDARASWSELSSQHDASAMGRSALLAVTSYVARRARLMIELSGASDVVLSGGASRNRGWVELFATLVDADVRVLDDMNRSGRGAAVTAARANGEELSATSDGETVSPQGPGVCLD